MVSDFGVEIVAMCEPMFREQPTAAQQKFLNDFFTPVLTEPGAASEQAESKYVGRKELIKSEIRMAEDAGLDGQKLRELRQALNRGFDGYVHGAYMTAMELYHPLRAEFMIEGHEGEGPRRHHMTAIAGKLYEVIYSLEYMAQAFENTSVEAELKEARRFLDNSAEPTGEGA